MTVPQKPNLLLLMADQMQGRVLRLGHPCKTPHLDALAARGVRFERAYTPDPVCSPARASLMTGLLPHNHGVLWVTHCVDKDQGLLREDKPHWAQRLVEAGYRTGYFGKWHVDRNETPGRFGWQVAGDAKGPMFRAFEKEVTGGHSHDYHFTLRRDSDLPPGYSHSVHYGVTDTPPEHREFGLATAMAEQFLGDAMKNRGQPWCCFVSTQAPHDPFIAGHKAFAQYDVNALPTQPNWRDPMPDKPGVYRKLARVWADRTDRELREAAACYYANITEVDACFGRLLAQLEAAGQLDNTIVVLTSDHGELLGAHGLYCKNVSAFEEAYNIPMVVAGPGITQGVVTPARVGLHDLCPTLLELLGVEPIANTDARSFAPVLRDPSRRQNDFTDGYAEYFGTRYMLTQRVLWHNDWKYVFNGFDIDELYNLANDPFEMRNLVELPEHKGTVKEMLGRVWDQIRRTGDHSLLNSDYPSLRLAEWGPGQGL